MQSRMHHVCDITHPTSPSHPWAKQIHKQEEAAAECLARYIIIWEKLQHCTTKKMSSNQEWIQKQTKSEAQETENYISDWQIENCLNCHGLTHTTWRGRDMALLFDTTTCTPAAHLHVRYPSLLSSLFFLPPHTGIRLWLTFTFREDRGELLGLMKWQPAVQMASWRSFACVCMWDTGI